jgi:hypothetical protein
MLMKIAYSNNCNNTVQDTILAYCMVYGMGMSCGAGKFIGTLMNKWK